MPGQDSININSLIIEKYSDPKAIESDWLSLECNASGFQSYLYLSSWFKNMCSKNGNEPLILKVSDQDGQCLLIVPWTLRHKAGFKVVSWFGDRQGAYRGAIFNEEFLKRLDQQGFIQLWERLKAEVKPADIIALYEQPEEILSYANPFLMLCGTSPSHNKTSETDLGQQPFEAFDNKCGSAKGRSKERRSERQIAKQASYAIEIAQSAEARLDLYEVLKAQKSVWFSRTGYRNFFEDENTDNFLREVCLLERSENNPVFSIIAALRAGEEVLAVNIALVSHGTGHGMIASIGNSKLNKFSPGTLLMKNILSWCAANGVNKFDFGAGESGLYGRWVTKVNALHSCFVPLNAKGAVLAPTLKSMQAWKRRVKQNKSLHSKILVASNKLKHL